MTLKDIGNNLLARLCSTQLRVGQGKRPVLLIGHSMGGIILKQVGWMSMFYTLHAWLITP
jgi:pimeloyl-ACP methyl ester carboxylesterase